MAAANCDFAAHHHVAAFHFNPRANGISVSAGLFDLQFDPVSRIRACVAPKLGSLTAVHNHQIKQSVEVEIGQSRTTRGFHACHPRQIASLSHPGLFVVRRAWDASGKKFRQSIAVDEIRALKHFLQRTSVTPWRVAVVDSADDLNANSANALLKSLEEPPARTVFLILSSAPGRLPPTIRSRCRLLRLEPLGAEDLTRVVTQVCAAAERPAPDADQMRALIRLGRGSARRVLQLMDGGALGIADMLTRLLASLPALDRVELHKLVALTGSRETETYTIAFDLLEEMLAEALRCAAMGANPARFPQLKSLVALMTPDSLADWAELWETIRKARGEAERLNLDKAALILTVFEKIDATARAAAKRAGRLVDRT